MTSMIFRAAVVAALAITLTGLALGCGSDSGTEPDSELPAADPASTGTAMTQPEEGPTSSTGTGAGVTSSATGPGSGTSSPAAPPRRTPAEAAPSPTLGTFQSGDSPSTPPASDAAGSAEVTAPAPASEPQSTESANPRDNVPDNPQLTDQILLQEVYAQMDLEQFALDPNQPIAPKDLNAYLVVGPLESEFNLSEVKGHPYLFLFPGLRYEVELEQSNEHPRDTVAYDPYRPRNDASDRIGRFPQPFPAWDPVTRFIYFPWFEPIIAAGKPNTLSGQTDGSPFGEQAPHYTLRNYFPSYGDHWFGANSTRGVLSTTVAGLMRDASHPAVQPQPLAWRVMPNQGGRNTSEHEAVNLWEPRDWKLDNYLRTTIMGRDGEPVGTQRSETRGVSGAELAGLTEGQGSKFMYQYPYPYQTPRTEWEILHPRLPIVRVTNHVNTILPMAVPGTPDGELTGTHYSVSFVISFQNRWASFSDPNRHLVRVKTGMVPENMMDPQQAWATPPTATRYGTTNGAADPGLHEEHFPNYWHNTDYMQHRLIGPVVLTVHQSDVLEPGTYSASPDVNQWEAPGPILEDRHIFGQLRGMHEDSYLIFPLPGKPNPGWPLPGHVFTNDNTHPGTDIWSEAGLDGHDW